MPEPTAPIHPSARSLPAETLLGLVEDLQVAAWLLPAGDDLRAYLELLLALPPDPDAWDEVARPFRDVVYAAADPAIADATHLAAAGAVALATARAARELPASHEHLAIELRAIARVCSPRARRAVS